MTTEQANAEAVRRIRQAKADGQWWLDLSDLPVLRVPDEIVELKHLLTALAVGENSLSVVGDGVTFKIETDRRSCLTDLGPLSELAKLRDLDVAWSYKLTSLEPLRGLTFLVSLDVSRCDRLVSLEPLRGLTALAELNVTGCGNLSSLDPLRGLTTLAELNVGWCRSLTSLEPLRGLTSLVSLDMSRCDKIASLEPLRGLAFLAKLDLYGCDGLMSLEPLRGLTALAELNLSDCDEVTSLEPLRGLTALADLTISSCGGLTAFEPVKSVLDQLRRLRVSDCPFLDLPSSVYGNGYYQNVINQIRAYFRDLEAGAVADAEVKLFVLGNGGVGKTQTRNRLCGKAFVPHHDSTHGI